MFYENFVRLAVQNGMSPSSAAEAMGYPRSSVSRWKTGTAPRRATLQRIANFFGCTVDELMGDDDIPVREIDDGLRQAMRERPELRVLFDASRDVPASAIYKAVALLTEYKERSDD